MKQPLKTAAVLALALTVCACVAGSGESAHAASGGLISQLLLGFWHGLIGPFTLIIEVVNRLLPRALPWHAHLYETRAVGAAYDVGFYFGLSGSPVIVWHRWSRR
jgi:hypothetical protein